MKPISGEKIKKEREAEATRKEAMIALMKTKDLQQIVRKDGWISVGFKVDVFYEKEGQVYYGWPDNEKLRRFEAHVWVWSRRLRQAMPIGIKTGIKELEIE